MKYNFAIPVSVKFVMDENEIIIDNIKDLKKIQKKHGVDLEFVIEEYEYKVDLEKESMEDDSVSINYQDIFDDVLSENMNAILELLSPVYDLNDLEEEDMDKIFNEISKKFNEHNLLFPRDYKFIMTGYDVEESYFILTLEIQKETSKASTEEELNDNEIKNIVEFLDTEFSDGWCSELEDIDLSNIVDNERSVYLNVWFKNKPIKFLN